MADKHLQVEMREQTAVVTISRPEAMNALSAEMVSGLIRVFRDLAENQDVRVVVLTGAGEKAFVSGGDIAAICNHNPAAALAMARQAHQLMDLVSAFPKPVIAAVNGYALGGGCQLAMACDIRIASERARFGQPEVNLGIIPGWGGTQRLPRLIGRGRALELFFTTDHIDAQEAMRIGLANRVVPHDQLLDTALEMARKIATKSRSALRNCKEAVCNGLEMDLFRANQHEANLFALCFANDDQKEGMAAFLEKRKARFTDI